MMKHILFLWTACLFASGVLALPSEAQSRLSRSEMTTEILTLKESVDRLLDSNSQLQLQNADLALQLRDMEALNAELTGRIETLQFQQGQSRQEAMEHIEEHADIGRALNDLGAKIDALEAQNLRTVQMLALLTGTLPDDIPALPDTGPDTGTGPDNASGQSPLPDDGAAPPDATEPAQDRSAVPVEDADALFADAKSRLLQFDYKGAEERFTLFLEQNEGHPQAGEAQYWLAEMYYQQGEYARSGDAYRTVILNYPDDLRAGDALVKLGRSLRLLDDTERACAILATLDNRYPEASPVTRQLADIERSRADCEG